MLYYSNGGPGPASKLLRVDAPPDADLVAWRRAPAASWQPHSGWVRDTYVQLDILGTGEFFMVDESQVPTVQEEIKARLAKFQ